MKPFDKQAGALLDDLLQVHRTWGRHRAVCNLSSALKRVVDDWKAANGYNDLLDAFSASVDEANRLRKLFDDAGQGERNVLALIDHYQRAAMDADDRIRAVRKLIEENGCDCPCDHHHEEHDDDCERCLACRIGGAITGQQAGRVP